VTLANINTTTPYNIYKLLDGGVSSYIQDQMIGLEMNQRSSQSMKNPVTPNLIKVLLTLLIMHHKYTLY
jgi:hypothetical protein